MKTFAISDIHGCYDELMALYKKLPIDPKKDRMVFLGDYVDRGLKTKQVVEQLMKWNKKYPHWVFLYGNHEDLMLDALLYGGRVYGSYDLWWSQGGKETANSYLPHNLSQYEKAIATPADFIPKAHIEWLAALPRYFEDDKYIYVHGGIKPGLTPAETDPYDLIWIRNEFIDWPGDFGGKKVIYGHTPGPLLEPNVMDNKIGIDTAVCYSALNKLTAIELPKEIFYFQENFKRSK